jgi:hypothetical protein
LDFLDKERNKIHNELRNLARLLGKGTHEITLDILEHEGNLLEYNLPEFQVINTNASFDEINHVEILNESNELKRISPKYKNFRGNELPEDISVFIPFGQQEFWHLSDNFGFPVRQRNELELRRRINKIIKLAKDKGEENVKMIEIFNSETFHRGTLLYGIAFAPKSLGILLDVISDNRSEVSISGEYINKEQISKDAVKIIKEDIDKLLSEEPGEYESYEYLVERYKEMVLGSNSMNISEKESSEIEEVFKEAKEKAIYLDQKKELNRELRKGDELADEYEDEMNLPQKESMRRR